MDKARKRHIEEMERIEAAMRKTESEYLKRDYGKALKRMRADLIEYDRWKVCSGCDEA